MNPPDLKQAAPVAEPGPLDSLIKAVTSIDIFYWRGRNRSILSTMPLLFGSAVLIVLCRTIFGFDGNLVTFLSQLTGFCFLSVACCAACVRPGAKLPSEIFMLAHLLAATWLISQALLAISIFPALRWFNRLTFETTLPVASIYSFSATAIIFTKSLLMSKRRPKWPYLIIVPLFVCSITTMFLNAVIMDVDTDQFLQNQAETLKQLFSVPQS